MTVRGHHVGIDWSQHGTYTYPLEDASSYVLPGDITISWGRDVEGDITLASTAGTLAFDLNNESQVFSRENSSSPIAGNILPGREVQYQVTDQATGTTYTLLDGILDNSQVTGDPASVFSASVLDGWGRPGARTISGSMHQGLRTGTAIGFILDHIGWTGGRSIDPGVTVMPWWWEEGTDAADAITKLVHSEGPPAIAYVEGGTFVFHDRHHRLFNTRSQTSQGLFTHIYPEGTGPGGDFKIEAGSFDYDDGLKTIVNTAEFSVPVRTVQQPAEVWSSDDLVTAPTGTVTVTVQATDPFINAVTPSVAGGEIQLQAGSVSAVTLSRTSGQSAILTITCTTDAVITRLALNANPVTVSRTEQVSASDPNSIGIFGEKEWPDAASPVFANPYDVQAIASKIVATYANYRPTITFTIVGLNTTYLTKMLTTKIGDRITVRNDKRGINGDFIVERLAHRITSLGLVHRLTITCQAVEPAQAANPFTFNVAGKGFDQGQFAADGIDNASTVFRFDTAAQGFDQGVFGT